MGGGIEGGTGSNRLGGCWGACEEEGMSGIADQDTVDTALETTEGVTTGSETSDVGGGKQPNCPLKPMCRGSENSPI